MGKLQNTALITAAVCQEQYEVLLGVLQDYLHEPDRAPLLPCSGSILVAAEKTGALGAFLSGSGSTVMAITLQRPEEVRTAMLQAARRQKVAAQALVLTADNHGYQIL